MRCNPLHLGAAWAGAFALVWIPIMPIQAQTVTSSGQVPITDVSGPIITSGDLVSGLYLGAPGPVQSFTCAVATGVRNEGLLLVSELSQGDLRVASRQQEVRLASTATDPVALESEHRVYRLSASLQADLLTVLTHREKSESASDGLVLGLAPAGTSSRATRAAKALVASMDGLLTIIEQMDPQDPGHEAATLLTLAVSRYNTFIEASSEAFLRDAPDELLAIEVVLSRLVVAGLTHEGNEAACG